MIHAQLVLVYYPGMADLTVGWALLHQSPRQFPTDMATSQSDPGRPLVETTSKLCQVGNKN